GGGHPERLRVGAHRPRQPGAPGPRRRRLLRHADAAEAAVDDLRPRGAPADGAAVRQELDQGDREGDQRVRHRPEPVQRRQRRAARAARADRGAPPRPREGRAQHRRGRAHQDPQRAPRRHAGPAGAAGAARRGRRRRRRRAPRRGGAAEAHRPADRGARRDAEGQGRRDPRGLMSTAPARARYVAIITDGNGRWAKRRGLPVLEGHRAGADVVKARLRDAVELGVEELTVYSFSTENWSRSDEEVAGLMSMFAQRIDAETPELHDEGVRMRFVGRRAGVDPELVERMEWAEALTAGNDRITLFVAFNYGGRAEIVDAARRFRDGGEA